MRIAKEEVKGVGYAVREHGLEGYGTCATGLRDNV